MSQPAAVPAPRGALPRRLPRRVPSPPPATSQYQARPQYGSATIKEWPADDRPRERLHSLGPRSLAARELLALLIETGTPAQDGRPGRSALDLAADLLRWFAPGEGPQSLRRIMTAPLQSLCEVPGIGPAKAAKVLAALELGRRAAEEALGALERLSSARDVYERMRLRLRDLPQEEFHVLLVNRNVELVRDVVVARGTLDSAEVHCRDVFRPAIAENAYGVVLVHNHPSGEPTPSAQDRAFTARVVEVGRVLGIHVLDHIVVGEGRYASFLELGLLGESQAGRGEP